MTFADLEKVRRELERFVVKSIAQLFGYTRVSSSSAIGDSDAAEKEDDASDPDGTKGQRPMVRINPFGFNSRPPKGLRGLWLRLGASNVLFLGIMPQQSYGPQGLNPGETAIYATPGQTFLLDQNGNLIATPSGTGTVQLGGNSHSIILDTLLSAMATALGFIATSNTGGSIITNPSSWATFLTNLGNGTYQSTVAKNG